MTRETLYTMNTAFRGEYSLYGYTYGRGEKAACIVGAMRGHEYQQLYICSLLSRKLAIIGLCFAYPVVAFLSNIYVKLRRLIRRK